MRTYYHDGQFCRTSKTGKGKAEDLTWPEQRRANKECLLWLELHPRIPTVHKLVFPGHMLAQDYDVDTSLVATIITWYMWQGVSKNTKYLLKKK